MSTKKTLVSFILCLLLTGPLSAEPFNHPRPPHGGQGSFQRGTPKEQIASLRQEIGALQTEQNIILERLHSQGEDIDLLRQEMQESYHEANSGLRKEIAHLEATTSTVEKEVGTVCKESEECRKTVKSLQDQIKQIKKNADQHGQNIISLEKAVLALVEILQKSDRGQETLTPKISLSPAAHTKSHTVKDGETLEKIAKTYGTTVNSIKEANGLVSDRIVTGKKLQIPTAE